MMKLLLVNKDSKFSEIHTYAADVHYFYGRRLKSYLLGRLATEVRQGILMIGK